MNYGAEPFVSTEYRGAMTELMAIQDDPQYVVGQIVQVSAKGQDSRMRSVKAKINAIVPSNGEWGYRLDTPAENRVYLETEID